ncbi:MAG: choice-of-anchor D domain-containing protein, partial [Terracidiphilus sp.]|nr:choice-of-anchor D domain-containing protein [Terracidiphilus sp.]
FANSCGTSLAAGANCTIHGHFAPTTTGAMTAAITITDNAAGSPQSIALTGTGINTTTVSLSATSLPFGNQVVGTTSASQSVTLTNTGVGTLTIGSILVTGTNASAFAFSNSCGTSLAVGANCTIHGHFAPTTAGAMTAAITITDNATGSPQSIALTGTGVTATTVSLSAKSLAFGNVLVGATSSSQSVTLTNTGSTTLTIGSISVTGTGAASFGFGNTCGSSLVAGTNCTIHGHFAPAAAGAYTAAVTITDNATGSPQSIALTGTGVTPTTVSLSATSLSFGSLQVGSTSPSQSVTLTNTGSAALLINSITVTGTNASAFAFSNSCGTSLAAGANCTIHGHFAPTAAGPMTAAITISDTTTNSPQSIALTGTGVTATTVSLNPTSLSFGNQKVGTTSASQSVTLTNTGAAALTITSITVGGTNASAFGFANSCGTSLAVGANCTIHGHFAPAATGPMTAAITLIDSATGSPQSIALSGTGTTVTGLTLPASGALPAATTNVAYTGAINASGGSGSGYQFTVNGTSIPTTGATVSISDGISVSSTGAGTLSISGTPTLTQIVTLTNVTVKDGAGNTAGPDTYTIAVNPPSPLTLEASTALPQATLNVAYSGAISASGGSGMGYAFTVNGTAIPTTGALVA